LFLLLGSCKNHQMDHILVLMEYLGYTVSFVTRWKYLWGGTWFKHNLYAKDRWGSASPQTVQLKLTPPLHFFLLHVATREVW
jgi:hypothetical protein